MQQPLPPRLGEKRRPDSPSLAVHPASLGVLQLDRLPLVDSLPLGRLLVDRLPLGRLPLGRLPLGRLPLSRLRLVDSL